MWKNGNWDPGIFLVKRHIGLCNNLDTEVNLQHEIFKKKKQSKKKHLKEFESQTTWDIKAFVQLHSISLSPVIM